MTTTFAQEADEANLHVSAGFDDLVEHVVEGVSHQLQVLNRKSLVVGEITGPPGTNGGSELVRAIRSSLPDWIQSSPSADEVRLTGEYHAEQDPASGRSGLVIQTFLRDAEGNQLHEFPKVLLADEVSLLTMLASNGSLPLKGEAGDSLSDARSAALAEILDKPRFALQSRGANWRVTTIVRPAADSPYGIEILDRVRTDRQGTEFFWPLAVARRNDLPLVEIANQHVFAVRLINDSRLPVAVTLTLNGANSLAIVPPSADKVPLREWWGSWIVGGQNSTAMVWGQASGNGRWQEFMAAGDGMITAVFSAAYTDQRPADEPRPEPAINGEQWLREGRKVEDRDHPLKLNFGLSRGVVSVRYRVKPAPR